MNNPNNILQKFPSLSKLIPIPLYHYCQTMKGRRYFFELLAYDVWYRRIVPVCSKTSTSSKLAKSQLQRGIVVVVTHAVPSWGTGDVFLEFVDTFPLGWAGLVVGLVVAGFVTSLLFCLASTFLVGVGLVWYRFSHGRTATHRSFQLQPQLSLPRS